MEIVIYIDIFINILKSLEDLKTGKQFLDNAIKKELKGNKYINRDM